MALLEDVKSIIKSILISTQKQMLVFDLAREYMASEGRCIPFQSLGYRTLPDFLKSIPDTMQLRTGQYNGRTLYFVQPVVNEATQHIEALVQEQNTAKNRLMEFVAVAPVLHQREWLYRPATIVITVLVLPPSMNHVTIWTDVTECTGVRDL
ncbi:hypothetical protein B566_EDAN010022 [Ephemera danica]|nr:hypothetical protein B566_EDAN010022 [Ephemera danica]